MPYLQRGAYTVGWVCALPVELAAARLMLDEQHDDLEQPDGDDNIYTFGSVAGHNVVLACLPAGQAGTSSAAAAAMQMKASFRSVRFGLMVGVGGGVPSAEHDVRLGDVVVSQPFETHSGVVQYDMGKTRPDGVVRTGLLNTPPKLLLNALAKVQANHLLDQSRLLGYITQLEKTKNYKRAKAGDDVLFKTNAIHIKGPTCNACNVDQTVHREPRDDDEAVAIHYGTIASGNQLMRDAEERDKISKQLGGVLCFEMEAAGLMNNFPCVVIRGICDYADSHKDKRWQAYAAGTAAAYAKEVLTVVPAAEVAKARTVQEAMASGVASNERMFGIISDEQEKTRATIKEIDRASKHDTRYAKILRWLDAPDPSSNFERAKQHKQAGTGVWFLESEAYAALKNGGARSLWLYGIPGCGKSVLSSTIIEDLISNGSEDKGQTVVYFFFDFNEPKKRKTVTMLRSVITQLLRHSDAVPKALVDCFESCDRGGRAASVGVYCEIVRDMITQRKKVFFVFDALDECDTPEELMDVLKAMASWQVGVLAMLFTSRLEHHIQATLEDCIDKTHIIGIQNETVDQDIQTYVKSKLMDDKELRRLSRHDNIRALIESSLAKKSCGMFRWAACQLDSIRQCKTERKLRYVLESLPKSLDETYERILLSINEDDRAIAKTILQWLLVSKRPLSLGEISEVVAIDPKRSIAYDATETLIEPSHALQICSSLVMVTTAPYYSRARSAKSGQALILAHYSVLEYLVSERLAHSKASMFASTAAQCHAFVASSCLGYLLMMEDGDFAGDKANDTESLAVYSAASWMDHFREAQQPEEALDKVVTLMERSSRAYINWIRLHNMDRDRQEKYMGRSIAPVLAVPQPLYYCCLGGLLDATKVLLDKGADVKAQGGRYGNALQAASAEGHIDIVELLLDKGADVKAQGGRYGNALQAASDKGYLDIVKLLLSEGADVNAQGRDSSNALQEASFGGNVGIVKLLLDNGADGNAPRTASERGYVDIVKLLLDRLTPTDRASRYLSTLAAAIARGHTTYVRLLLGLEDSKEAALDQHGWSPLLIAQSFGKDDIVSLLMAKGLGGTMAKDTILRPTALIKAVSVSLVSIIDGGKTANTDDRNELGRSIQVRANHPFTPSRSFYFEIHINIDSGANRHNLIGIGICQDHSSCWGMPGLNTGSWGFHGGDGKLYVQSGREITYTTGQTYGTGDVVGCGVNYEKDELYFTKNSDYIGRAAGAPAGRLFAVVGIGDKGVSLSINFGERKFRYQTL